MHRAPFHITPVLLLLACASPGKPTPGERLREVKDGLGERAGLVLEKDAYGDSATRVVYLDQGWKPLETLWFYHADQGSVLLPYDTLVHLEQADKQELVIDPQNLSRYRLLNLHKSPDNPHALPVGFSRHGDQAGLTCAACHTTQINYRGTALRIDGAPAMADISGFIRSIKDALSATLADPAKLARFAAAVPGGGASEKHREAARASLQKSAAWFDSYCEANRSTTVEGFGRLDAIGRIINQVIRFTSGPKNSAEPNAPASFPLIWDAPRHDYVQWTGFAPNAGAGSLGRNAGEVIGVFGHIDVQHYETEKEAKRGYKSSIEANALVAMEESLRKLKSPRWPEDVLPPIDQALAARGQALYKTACSSCHALLDRDDPRRHVTAQITAIDSVGTDDTSARNLVGARAPAGILAGAISPKGEKYGAELSALELLGDLVTRALSAQPAAALAATANAKLHGIDKSDKQGDFKRTSAADPTSELLAYKARPLNGIWASSPYLHNGSVPTLYDLLLPVSERPTRFAVGRLEFDPKKVGYLSDGAEPFVLDTGVKGNSNRGHEYGAKLSTEDRWALVEYLKTL